MKKANVKTVNRFLVGSYHHGAVHYVKTENEAYSLMFKICEDNPEDYVFINREQQKRDPDEGSYAYVLKQHSVFQNKKLYSFTVQYSDDIEAYYDYENYINIYTGEIISYFN